MPVIYCNFHMGDFRHKVYLVDDKALTELGAFTVEDLPGAIASFANKEGINKVELEASLTYGNALAEAITEYSMKEYSNQACFCNRGYIS